MGEPIGVATESQPERWAHLPAAVREEIDVFESELRRFQQGLMPEKVFLEFRLRHGVYGQRQAGVQMQRIKIPMGMLTTAQMERAGRSVGRVRRRHQPHHHAAGHSVPLRRHQRHARHLPPSGRGGHHHARGLRQHGAQRDRLPVRGRLPDESVRRHALCRGHGLLSCCAIPDAQNFGRKFKIAFSGCAAACLRTGDDARHRRDRGGSRGKRQAPARASPVYLGGGLGAIPHQAKLYSEFVPGRGDAAAGAGGRPRLRAPRREEESRQGPHEVPGGEAGHGRVRQAGPRGAREAAARSALDRVHERGRAIRRAAAEAAVGAEARHGHIRSSKDGRAPACARRRRRATRWSPIFLPLGDITAWQFRNLASICRKYVSDTVRTTVDQNLLLRWVSNGDLPALYEDLKSLDLAQPGAHGMANVTACPGTDSCKLGIASSRGLAAVLHEEFQNGMSRLRRPRRSQDQDQRLLQCLRPASHRRHRLLRVEPPRGPARGADLPGGAGRHRYRTTPPPSACRWARCPAKDVPAVVAKLTDLYTRERQGAETFAEFTQRVGKGRIKQEIDPFRPSAGLCGEARLLPGQPPAMGLLHVHGSGRVRRRDGHAGGVFAGGCRPHDVRSDAAPRSRDDWRRPPRPPFEA